jgi:hypothetical protein
MVDTECTTKIMSRKKLAKWKTWSIKFGIICGIVTAGCGAFNAILGTIQEWKETFDKEEEKVAMVETQEEFHLEQKIHGNLPPGAKLTKTVEMPENDEGETVDWSDGEPTDPEPRPLPKVKEQVEESKKDNKTGLWVWYVLMFGGGVMVWALFKKNKANGQTRK